MLPTGGLGEGTGGGTGRGLGDGDGEGVPVIPKAVLRSSRGFTRPLRGSVTCALTARRHAQKMV